MKLKPPALTTAKITPRLWRNYTESECQMFRDFCSQKISNKSWLEKAAIKVGMQNQPLSDVMECFFLLVLKISQNDRLKY